MECPIPVLHKSRRSQAADTQGFEIDTLAQQCRAAAYRLTDDDLTKKNHATSTKNNITGIYEKWRR